MPENFKKALEESLPYAMSGSFGGFIAQLNGIRKGNKLTITMLFCNIIISAWVGAVVGPNLPERCTDSRFAITSVLGVLAFAILDLIEKQGINLILKKLGIGKQ